MSDANAEEVVDYEEDISEVEKATVSAPDAAPDQDQAEDRPNLEVATEGETKKEENGATDASNPMSLPPQGTEVFIGGIPKTATEAQIKDFAEAVGKVHSVKLAKDPNNAEQNRGFGFVRFFAKESADAAKQKLHEKELSGTGSKLRVSSSQSKYKLYVGNIPKAITKEQLTNELTNNFQGLESMDLVMSRENPKENRGFAFLAFYNHECAAAAKSALSKSPCSLQGRQLTVSYADPKNDPQQQQAPSVQSKAVYVGNLPPGTSEEKLKDLFSKFGEIAKVVIPAATDKRPEQRFGFVHFADQSSTEKAVSEADGGQRPELDGKTLEVKAARPMTAASEQQHGHDGGYGYGETSYNFGGRSPMGRGNMRGGRGSGRGGPSYPPRGRGGRGGRRGSFARGGPGGFDQGYDQAFGGGTGGSYGYDQGYDAYGTYSPAVGLGGVAGTAATPAGMTMVPMMLPSGQVGYVLQSADAGAAEFSGYDSYGPDRFYGGEGSYSGSGAGGGRGRGGGRSSRYRPY